MDLEVLIEVSARHVHLTREHVDILFGKDAELLPRKALTTPGLFACQQRVDVLGPKGTLRNVTILAPCRKYTQVEISKTDARTIGIEAPVRESGHLEDTPGCTLVGTVGSVELRGGVIIARRHIHLKTNEAETLGILDRDIIGIEVGDGERRLLFKDVLVRLSKKAGTFVHIDTDEGNAAGISGRGYGTIVRLDGGEK